MTRPSPHSKPGQPSPAKSRSMLGAIVALSAAGLAALAIVAAAVQAQYPTLAADQDALACLQHDSHSTGQQVVIPKPDGEGFLSIDAFELTNYEFNRFVDATGYKTVAEQEWKDPQTGQTVKPGSAVFQAPDSVASVARAAITQWWSFEAGADWQQPNGASSNIDDRENYPVVQIALEDARAYAHWAGRRLPTASEWEYAARYEEREKRQDWHVSKEDNKSRKWIANTWQGIFPLRDTADDGFTDIAPVGCYPPLASGLHDMIGNVWEWVETPPGKPGNWATTENKLPSITTDNPLNTVPEGAEAALIMGGSFLCSPNFCMNYHPGASMEQDATLGTNHIGFRTVADVPAPGES